MRNEPKPTDEQQATEARREQMVKLVTKSFYNELVNYGVKDGEIMRVASHLLDNIMGKGDEPREGVQHHRDLFTVGCVMDEWKEHCRLGVDGTSIRPLDAALAGTVLGWLAAPGVRDSFVTQFPEDERSLRAYFADPAREYFGIFEEGNPVGIIGAENINRQSSKLEMKKLIGEPAVQGKGVGKRATFAFLYHAFTIRGAHKVYIHSRDINIRNINLNSRFGFEVEGVFFEDVEVDGRRQDVIRMALTKPKWLKIFATA